MDTDKIIVKQIIEGNVELYPNLVNKYYPKITSFIIKMGVNSEDAKDLTQEIFIKVYNNLHKYNDNWEFSTWIFRVAINSFKDSKKKKLIRTEDLDDFILKASDFEPDRHIDKLYYKELIQKMFKSMDKDIKAMVILKYCYELSFKEIGEIFKKSPESVKMKILRTRKKLCELHGKSFEEDEKYEVQI